MLQAAMNIRAMIAAGIHVNRDEISAAEVLALLIIEEERRNYESEQADRESER